MENRKIIIYSLFADLLGVLLFIFAIQIHNNIILYTFYLIALLLYIAAILALYKNFKKNNKAIFIFIMFITLILIVLCTYFIII